MYEDWTKSDLIYKIRQLQGEKRDLEDTIRSLKEENYHLKFRIDQELEPRIRAERRAYDGWVTDPQRGMP